MERKVNFNFVVGDDKPGFGIKKEVEKTESDEEYEESFETKSGGQTYLNIGKGFEEKELLEEEMEGVISDDDEEEEMIPLLEPEVQVHITEPVKFEPKSRKKKKYYYPQPERIRIAFCIPCNMQFPSTDLFELHQSTEHQDERPYSCRHCGKAFQNLANCQRHETIHDPNRFKGEPEFQCNFCPRRFHIKVSLHTHVRTVHLGKNIKKYSYKRPVVLHRSTKGVVLNPNFFKPKPVIPPENPHLQFPRANLEVVKKKPKPRQISKQTSSKCKLCNMWLSNNSNLTRHMKLVHGGFKQEVDELDSNKPFKCKYCPRGFNVLQAMKLHQTRAHLKGWSTRPNSQEEDMSRLCKTENDDNEEDQIKYQVDLNSEKPYKCKYCTRGFAKLQAMKLHQIRAHIRRWSSGLKRKEGNTSRIRNTVNDDDEDQVEYQDISDSEKPFQCKYCERGFDNLRAVTIHQIRMHIKRWPSGLKRKEGNMPKICKTVNVRNAAAVAAILNYQTVRVSLFKWNFPQGMIDRCRALYGVDEEEL